MFVLGKFIASVFDNMAVSTLTPVEVVGSQSNEGVSTFPGCKFWLTELPLSLVASAVTFALSSVYSLIILNPGDFVATFFGKQGHQVSTPKCRLPK